MYRSPLEHMHCALAFQLLRDANYNILDGLTKIEQLEVRLLVRICSFALQTRPEPVWHDVSFL